MEIHFSFRKREEFRYLADINGFNPSIIGLLATTGFATRNYWELLQELLNTSDRWPEWPTISFSDHYSRDEQLLTKLIFDQAEERKDLVSHMEVAKSQMTIFETIFSTESPSDLMLEYVQGVAHQLTVPEKGKLKLASRYEHLESKVKLN